MCTRDFGAGMFTACITTRVVRSKLFRGEYRRSREIEIFTVSGKLSERND